MLANAAHPSYWAPFVVVGEGAAGTLAEKKQTNARPPPKTKAVDWKKDVFGR